MLSLSTSVKKSFPFQSHYKSLNEGKLDLHYVREGQGEKTVMVHGNPSWSFLFRHLIKDLSEEGFQAMALDHIGCGLSSKPQDYSYCLQQHVDNFAELMDELGKEKVNLIVHDWGGAIALAWAGKNPERVKRLVITNTAAYRSKDIPHRIALCKLPVIGPFLIRQFNAFAYPALSMASAKGLSPEAREGLIFPYNSFENRIAISRFVEDIPLSEAHPSYQFLFEVEKNLSQLTCPKLILWGMKDFCFNTKFLTRWKEIYPEAQVEELPQAGHYLFEDEPELVSQKILQFLKG